MEMNYQTFKDRNSDEINEKSLLLEGYYNNNNKFYDIEENQVKRPMKIPKFIYNNRGNCEKICSKILCCKKFKPLENIRQEELKAYYRLKDMAILQYDENNSDHENSLKNLFIAALNVDLTHNLESVEWKSIGFQVNIKINIDFFFQVFIIF